MLELPFVLTLIYYFGDRAPMIAKKQHPSMVACQAEAKELRDANFYISSWDEGKNGAPPTRAIAVCVSGTWPG